MNAKYIGPLSRFRRYSDIRKEYDLLVVLSGPEPQRTLLENILMEQVKIVNCNTLVVRGLPEKSQRIRISESLSVVSSLESEALNKAMLASDIIISRPGYSTIMDIAALGSNAIFIPTPGQTEQEYIAGELEKKKLFFVARQETFDLRVALEKSRHYTGFSHGEFDNSALRDRIVQFLLRLN
jgi:predicted glycosyltransferase